MESLLRKPSQTHKICGELGRQAGVCEHKACLFLRWADSQDKLSIFGRSKLPTGMLNGIIFLLKYARKTISRAAVLWLALSWGVKWLAKTMGCPALMGSGLTRK